MMWVLFGLCSVVASLVATYTIREIDKEVYSKSKQVIVTDIKVTPHVPYKNVPFEVKP